jgi:hypothetical protein
MFVIEDPVREVPMTNVPAGAQLSPDGFYWWDGSTWQPVNAGATGQEPPGGAEGEMPKLEHAWGESLLAEVEVPEMQADATEGTA